MTIRKIKKDLRMEREISVQNLRLAYLPHSLCIRLSEKYGLIKEEYQAVETIVDINSGEMIELSEPYKNRTPEKKKIRETKFSLFLLPTLYNSSIVLVELFYQLLEIMPSPMSPADLILK